MMTACASLCAIVLAVVAPKETYDIVRVLKDGQTLRYTVTRTTDKSGESMLVGGGGTWNVELKVSAGEEEGDLKVNALRTAVRLNAEDSPYTPDDVLRRLRMPLRSVVTIHHDGPLTVTETQRTASEFASGTPWVQDVLLIKLPGHKVAKGDEWTDVRKVPSFRPDGRSTDQTFRYKLIGLEKLDNMMCYRISMVSTLERRLGSGIKPPNDDLPRIRITLKSEVKYTMFVACTDGKVVKKLGLETTSIDASGGPIPIHNTAAMNLLVKLQK